MSTEYSLRIIMAQGLKNPPLRHKESTTGEWSCTKCLHSNYSVRCFSDEIPAMLEVFRHGGVFAGCVAGVANPLWKRSHHKKTLLIMNKFTQPVLIVELFFFFNFFFYFSTAGRFFAQQHRRWSNSLIALIMSFRWLVTWLGFLWGEKEMKWLSFSCELSETSMKSNRVKWKKNKNAKLSCFVSDEPDLKLKAHPLRVTVWLRVVPGT